jgi:hypothetical protein
MAGAVARLLLLVALLAAAALGTWGGDARTLYTLLLDGTVKRSDDGGRASLRS